MTNFKILYYNEIMRFFALFLFLDIFAKEVARYCHPHSDLFKLVFNSQLAMGISGNFFFKFVLPICLLPLPWLFTRFYKMQLPKFTLEILYAGMIGNLLYRFMPAGVVDFLTVPFTPFYCNLADIYGWIGTFLLFYGAIKHDSKFKNKPPFVTRKNIFLNS